jgi:hypothetical protein
MSTNKLLTPDNHALLLIDHQYLQLLTLRSHDAAQVIGNQLVVSSIPTRPTIYPFRRLPVPSTTASKVVKNPYKSRV